MDLHTENKKKRLQKNTLAIKTCKGNNSCWTNCDHLGTCQPLITEACQWTSVNHNNHNNGMYNNVTNNKQQTTMVTVNNENAKYITNE